MFIKLGETILSRVATVNYPKEKQVSPENLRGRPDINLQSCTGEGNCSLVCPSRAISLEPWRVDLGKCIFCGLCAESCPSNAIRMTGDFELASHQRSALVVAQDGIPVEAAITEKTIQQPGGAAPTTQTNASGRPPLPMSLISPSGDLEVMSQELKNRITRHLQRSLHIRHLDCGSCNGCDWELNALLNPVHDIQRLGFDFVASPRHADVLLVTGVMNRNLTTAALRTYRAMPEPRLVVAVGACGCSGGIFSSNYAGGGGINTVLPVDVYIPGCPPRPQALIYGLLLAVGRIAEREQ
ncbi:MAG: NADH-quinone oxidoreductase subunit NuoB [Chloroflexi bacterium]|uniref:NADH-quinone oxidoreductase subunit NuoB n=1 Tax=Candidatus Chlorohelix allophototropha TaxID=3003348 RepID=A0A8T7M3C2_9CHLR|nr:NADH-quinone oxidoreductase subunit NuoB [Chloroflexota bacterium]WJW65747.1 NADH-quinone oxidoreductase subunit NuoB [Chloroflexota bacterium L227-S17]